MAVVPTPATFAFGTPAPSATMTTGVGDPLRFLLAPPIAELWQDTGVSLVTSGTYQALGFNQEDVDSANGHSTTTNTSRYTAVYSGWYRIGGGVAIVSDGSGTGNRAVKIYVNGTPAQASLVLERGLSGNTCGVPVRSKLVYLNAGDFVEIYAMQSSGGALLTAGDSVGGATSMNVEFVSN